MEEIQRLIEGATLGSKQQHLNLAVFPLIMPDSSAQLEYIVLEDALEQGLTIAEQHKPNVPELEIENKTGKDVVIVTGEYIIGGDQNRKVSVNIYLREGFKGKIPVHCVEARRWDDDIGKKKKFGYGGHSPTTIKRAASQRAVWDEVTTTLGSSGVSSRTSDLGAVYREKQRDIEDFAKKFKPLPNQTGLVAVISAPTGKNPNHKKFAFDFFENPTVLKKHYKNIIRRHVVEAIPYGQKEIKVGRAEVRTFLKEFTTILTSKEQRKISEGIDYEITTSRGKGSALLRGDKAMYVELTTE